MVAQADAGDTGADDQDIDVAIQRQRRVVRTSQRRVVIGSLLVEGNLTANATERQQSSDGNQGEIKVIPITEWRENRIIAVTTAQRREPTQARSRQTVTRILDVAAAIVDEQGVDAATTRTIADRAGVAYPSLYRFFA